MKPPDRSNESLRSLLAARERWPLLMGIVNVTPDSFSDGGEFLNPETAADHALRLHRDGADIIDVGGESTRPGADPVPVEEELRRVVPVVRAIRAASSDVPISVDTSKPMVMQACANAGASMINDVCALQQPGALQSAAASGLSVCLMHMQGLPTIMQHQPQYEQVVVETLGFLLERVAVCERIGIERENIVIDPGFGFGKTLEHNLSLLANLDRFVGTGLPVLIGLSRKSMLKTLLGRELGERLVASVALAMEAAAFGAAILRVHDVRETNDARQIRWQVKAYRDPVADPEQSVSNPTSGNAR